ncbi:hypothetical protein HNY73_003618 [Argiope bruennichi]|uniref:Uncharacterized protein n=1 Tax=Argiope bruennichi TaxID=94029 RepID=A0A8T0FR65_ARGBR|nr:hypothetical protein HNY73_003618 [Argiope bruennichi]
MDKNKIEGQEDGERDREKKEGIITTAHEYIGKKEKRESYFVLKTRGHGYTYAMVITAEESSELQIRPTEDGKLQGERNRGRKI